MNHVFGKSKHSLRIVILQIIDIRGRFHEDRVAYHKERIQFHKDAAASKRKDRELSRSLDGNKRLYMTSGKLRILFVDLGNVCRFDT